MMNSLRVIFGKCMKFGQVLYLKDKAFNHLRVEIHFCPWSFLIRFQFDKKMLN